MGDLGKHDLDLPYEANPGPVQMPDIDQAELAGGVVVMAAVINVPDLGPKPALTFRFAAADGSGFLRPVVLVADDDQLAKLRPLINQSIAEARRAAALAPRGDD